MFPLLVSGTFSGASWTVLTASISQTLATCSGLSETSVFPTSWGQSASCSVSGSFHRFQPPWSSTRQVWGLVSPKGCRNGWSTSPGSTSRIWTETNGRNEREGTNRFHPSCLRHFPYLFTYPERLRDILQSPSFTIHLGSITWLVSPFHPFLLHFLSPHFCRPGFGLAPHACLGLCSLRNLG